MCEGATDPSSQPSKFGDNFFYRILYKNALNMNDTLFMYRTFYGSFLLFNFFFTVPTKYEARFWIFVDNTLTHRSSVKTNLFAIFCVKNNFSLTNSFDRTSDIWFHCCKIRFHIAWMQSFLYDFWRLNITWFYGNIKIKLSKIKYGIIV